MTEHPHATTTPTLQGLGRTNDPTAGIIDSQSRTMREKRGEVYGYEGGKHVKARKRFILIDTLRRLRRLFTCRCLLAIFN
jgi:hypothetical protein